MPFDTFLFDLDGTLIDSVEDLTTAVNLLRIELSLAALDSSLVRGYIGDGATLLVKRALPQGFFSEAHLRRFLDLYGDHLLDRTTIYPGIRDFLDMQREKKMGVVTNKPLRFARRLLDALGLLSFFPAIVGGESCAAKKPDPAPVLLALTELRSDPAGTVFIGDHHTDLQAGRAAGVRTCFCAFGIGRSGGVPFDFLAQTPADLPRLFPREAR
jgi:phosphoglycolate phosphatase